MYVFRPKYITFPPLKVSSSVRIESMGSPLVMGCDRISELPDALLTKILSYLPTKDSVKTSVLSKRWEFLWHMVPGLDLQVTDFCHYDEEVYETFIYNFLAFNEKSRMQKFKIIYAEWYISGLKVMDWVEKTVDRGIQHLDIERYMNNWDQGILPQNIYKSKTLVSLKLDSIPMESQNFVVSLPCLKIMHLEDIVYDDDDPLVIEKLLSGCPVLEDFTLIRFCNGSHRDVLLFLRVRSETLKRFWFSFENCRDISTDFSVEIEASGLEYLSFNDNQSDKIVVKNLTSLLSIDIDTEFNVEFGSHLDPTDLRKRDTIHNFLTGVSNVRHMIISYLTVKVLCLYSSLWQIPNFDNLYRLEAKFFSEMLEFVPVFLESCPNLKKLIVDYFVNKKAERVELSYVPRCLLLTLECVEIKNLIRKEKSGNKLVVYFLEKAAVLKKMSVSFTDSPQTSVEIDLSKRVLSG